MPVLYRKYRPQSFADVTGQEHVTRTLTAALALGRLSHAYLFSGPRGVGKTTTARLLAKAVNCTVRSQPAPIGASGKSEVRSQKSGGQVSPLRSRSAGQAGVRCQVSNGEPCNTCQRCVEITEGRCLDVIEIDAASHTGVDHVREHIVDTVRLVPAQARRKVFIIDEVHMLSTSAFNALLKTLEEPPDHLLFILATTELHRVPETVRSRCQHFTFRRIPEAVIAARLRTIAASESVRVDDDVIAAVSRSADGSVRDAETLLGQLFALGGKEVTLTDAAGILPRSSVAQARSFADALVGGDAAASLSCLRAAEADGFDAEAFTRDVIAALRDEIHATVAQPDIGFPSRVRALRAACDLLDRIGRTDHPFLLLEAMALGVVGERGDQQQESVLPHTRAAVAPTIVPAPRVPVRDAPPASASIRAADVPAHPASDGVETLATLRASWGAIVQRSGAANHALVYLLEGGRPQAVADGVLTIGFKYKLHAQKAREAKANAAIAGAVSAVAGQPLRVETTVITSDAFVALDAAVRPNTGDVVADAALEVFGGHVVE